ncbi:MAG: ferredoxin [Actinomycetota bacterium]|nr:ferredoxin [Actinomycetota bacterium]
MKVRVDTELCVGHGRCYALAPDVFEADDRGHCLVPGEVVAPDLEEKARIGEQNCPEHAIAIDE